MRILNLGSLNIDKVYGVEHFVAAGETISSTTFETGCGGKGLNQSVALARAGAGVAHAGAVGPDGDLLIDTLEEAGVDIHPLRKLVTVSGHAVIQRTPAGQNCIIVCAGANGEVTTAYIDEVLAGFEAGDILLLQNEISNVDYAIRAAKKQGMKVAFNASPITPQLLQYPLELVDYYLINEVEGKALAGAEVTGNEEILAALVRRFAGAAIVLTVGKDGVYYQCGTERAHHGIYDVPVVDTTAAGDTFCGFFLASIAKGLCAADALRYASLASSIAVSRKGAAGSIPTWDEVEAFAETATEL